MTSRRLALHAVAGFALARGSLASRAAGSLLRVGPRREFRSLAAAARQAVDGAVIEVDAGEYRGDVAVWSRDALTLRAVGGRVRLLADGAAAEYKGIWVVRGRDVSIEGFDFEGAAVAGRNGAGIRFETGSLRVRDCGFFRNEMGLLTNNDPQSELVVEDCEFAHNMRPDGHDHNLYAGAIAQLTVTGSYLHHATHGHLLKSRAARNLIAYNRLTDEADGQASYELEFPNGGVAHVIGNMVQQGPRTENPHLISFGAEGYRWPENALTLSHNTLVDDLSEGGVWLRVRPGGGPSRIVNNLLVGHARWDAGDAAELHNNLTLPRGRLSTTGPDAYHVPRDLEARLRAVAVGVERGAPMTPDRQYRHPRRTQALTTPATLVGALQAMTPSNR